MKKFLIGLALMVLVAISSACGEYNDERGKGDAPVSNRKGDDAPAVVINFPDSFSNIAFKCLNGNGLYVTTRDAAPQIVKDDPNCRGNEITFGN